MRSSFKKLLISFLSRSCFVVCHSGRWFLYHVTFSCKDPSRLGRYVKSPLKVQRCPPRKQTNFTYCFFLQSGRRATKAFLREYKLRRTRIEQESALRASRNEGRPQSGITVTVRSASGSDDSPFQEDPPPEYAITQNRTDSSVAQATNRYPRDSITSVTSLETSQQENPVRRSSAGVKLPPLSREREASRQQSENLAREGSGDSVTSARKVDVDVKRSPLPSRNQRVGDISN